MKKYLSVIVLLMMIFLLTSCGQEKCGKCGATARENMRFCSECGADLSHKVQEETSSQKLSGEELYDSVSSCVVTITAESSQLTSTGTGFFYTNDIIVTNYHVIEGCSSAAVTLSNGQTYAVLSVVGYDQAKDIALLKTKISNGKPIPTRNENVKTGEKVYAIGNSLGFLEGSLSEGIVSSAQRELNGNTYIQTTAAVTHGNSGGPLLDEYGRVIGIISSGFGEGLNLNLAIPIDEIKSISTANPLSMNEFSVATVPYNVLLNFVKQKGESTFSGYRYVFNDVNGKTHISLSYSTKYDFIGIEYHVDDNFSFDIRIYPDKSTCSVGANLRDESLNEVLDTALRGYTLEEVEKSKIYALNPAYQFEFVFWDGYDEEYYSTWSNYYHNYLDDVFIVYDYYITEVAGLSCDSKALGFPSAK